MKKIFLLVSLIVFMILLVACGDAKYNELIEKANEFIKEEKYEEAHNTLEEALEEKEDDIYATDTIVQLDAIIETLPKIGAEKPETLIDQLKEVSTYEDGSELLIDLAEQYIEQLQSVDQLLTQIESFEKEDNFEEAIEEVNKILDHKEDLTLSLISNQYSEQLEKLKTDLETNHLFSIIKGYVRNQTDQTGITYCQVSEDNMLCNTVDVGVSGARDIVAIHKESEDSLRIETNEERDIMITNIKEDSFTLDGDHYTKVTAEETLDHFPGSSSINSLFDQKEIEELIEFTQINYFDLSSDVLKEDQHNAFQDYSEEEIEYAQVWLYYNPSGPPYSTLYVSKWEEGEPIAPSVYDEKGIDFKQDVINLTGEFGADGQISYTSNGDGTINIYDIPRKWPAEYELEGGVKAYTTHIMDNPETIELPKGTIEELLPILETMKIDL